jgi:coenzyme PQQ precursor peptide PqqA
MRRMLGGRSGAARGRVRIWQVRTTMAWTTPTLVEICIGLEINGYLPAEF